MRYLLFLLLIMMFIPACDSALKNNLPPLECSSNEDCEGYQVCDAGYCINDDLKDSDIDFNFSIIPTNSDTNKKYYHSKTTEPLNIDTLQQYIEETRKIEVKVSDRIILTGEIIAEKNIDYKLTAFKKDEELKFSTKSYRVKEDGVEKVYYHLKIPKGEYNLYVESEKEFPPFNIDILELSDDKNIDINIEDELKKRESEFQKVTGKIKYTFKDNNENYLDEFIIYAYKYNDKNVEEIISSKQIYDRASGSFSILIKKDILPFFIKVKSLNSNLKNIEVNKMIDYIDEEDPDLGDINIGTFSEFYNIKINITGNCKTYENDIFNSLSIKIKGNINEITKYENILEPIRIDRNNSSEIAVFEDRVAKGSYNLEIYAPYESCYVSAFDNISIDENNREFSIMLKQKIPISGRVFGVSNATLKFIRKDNHNSSFKISTKAEDGYYNVNLEPGLYDITIEPDMKTHSNWVYLDQAIDLYNYQDGFDFFIPESILVKLHVFTTNNKPLVSSLVKLNILPKDNQDCNFILPKTTYPLYQTVTDESGSFIVPIPIVTCF